MNLYKSTKPPTRHIFVEYPMTLDKSKDWGEGNIQEFPNGGFLQFQNGKITHGVQPNEDLSAPIGWVKTDEQDIFKKKNIYAVQNKFPIVQLKTKDGDMEYQNPNKNGWVCFNQLENNTPDTTDSWFVTNDQFQKLYIPC